uniref:Ctr_104_T conopeptide n=2 Tax=Splinoconus TaxID=2056757 RepID=A0A0C9RYP1_CONTD
MQLYTYLYLLVPLVALHLILGTGTLAHGGALTEDRSADTTALKPEPALLQRSAARSTDDNGKDRLTEGKRTINKRRNAARRSDEEIRETVITTQEAGK